LALALWPAFLGLAFPKTATIFALGTPLRPRIEYKYKEIPLKPQGQSGENRIFAFRFSGNPGNDQMGFWQMAFKGGQSKQKHMKIPGFQASTAASIFVLQ
jgi:hypothetical protein